MRLPFGLWTVVGVLVIAALIYAILEPVSIFGYDGEALGESLESAVPDSHGSSKCDEQQNDVWVCFVGLNMSAQYRMTADDDGCWTADRVRYQGDPGAPAEEFSGCVNLLDVTGLSELLDV